MEILAEAGKGKNEGMERLRGERKEERDTKILALESTGALGVIKGWHSTD